LLMELCMVFVVLSLVGLKIALLYFSVLCIFSILAGLVFSKLNLTETYKGVTVKGDGFFSNNQGSKMKQALNDAWAFRYRMLPYLFIGGFIGACIYGFIPAEFLTKHGSSDGSFSVLIVAVMWVRMYIRPYTMVPIAEALVSKGMSMGTVIALVIGGAGASIPEVVMLSKLFKKKFLVAFIATILIVATGTGLIINAIF